MGILSNLFRTSYHYVTDEEYASWDREPVQPHHHEPVKTVKKTPKKKATATPKATTPKRKKTAPKATTTPKPTPKRSKASKKRRNRKRRKAAAITPLKQTSVYRVISCNSLDQTIKVVA